MRRGTCSLEIVTGDRSSIVISYTSSEVTSSASTRQVFDKKLAVLPGRNRLPATRDVRQILGVNVTALSTRQAIGLVANKVARRQPGIFAFCNAHTANLASACPDLREALRHATVFNDGIGVDIASRMLYGTSFPENLNGTDFTPALLDALPAATPVFLLGSRPGVARDAGAVLERRHDIKVVGTHHGFFAPNEEPELVRRIAASGAALVIVAMGNPWQELWAARHHAALSAPVLCVGAFLDFTAGRVVRAPHMVRNMRMEWIYRLMQEPGRLARRYLLGNGSFLLAVLQQRAARQVLANAVHGSRSRTEPAIE